MDSSIRSQSFRKKEICIEDEMDINTKSQIKNISRAKKSKSKSKKKVEYDKILKVTKRYYSAEVTTEKIKIRRVKVKVSKTLSNQR